MFSSLYRRERIKIITSQQHLTHAKLFWGKLHHPVWLEFELAGLLLVAGKQRLNYASLSNDFNEPFEMSLMYFVSRG